jgi:3-hydroxyisobutyrate dehydrogenase-like beta-hydroxyacid dehydrogenase
VTGVPGAAGRQAGVPSGVGFVGLGQMGAPMAKHLLGWPGGLTVYDVRADATSRLAAKGARVAATLRELAAAAGVISVMVRDDAQVEDVVCGDGGLLAAAAPGAVIAIHSTIGDETAPRLARRAGARGVHLVDAPVSGGFMAARDGSLAVMVGASGAAFARCQDAFRPWAGLVMHAGPVGAGTRAKLARNLLHFISFAAAGEALRLAEAAGVDLKELGQVVRHTDAITGGPGAIMLRDTAAQLPAGDGLYRILAHARDLGEKDLSLAAELAAKLGVDLPLGRLARQHLASALGVADAVQTDAAQTNGQEST